MSASLLLLALSTTGTAQEAAQEQVMLIDDFRDGDAVSALGTRWSAVSDRVMGGISDVSAAVRDDDRPHLHLTGQVKNVPGYGTPGFVQVGLDLGGLDATGYTGLRLVVKGDGGTYGAHLRTPDVRRPWQSYRGRFVATDSWTEIEIPFGEFEAYRMTPELDLRQLRRLSLIAVDRTGAADLRISEISLY